MKQLGEIIRDLRKKEQITQEKLAEYLGVSFQSVSRWENGLAYPDVTLIPDIARYFKVSTDILFDMEQENLSERRNYFNSTFARYRQEGKLELQKELMENAIKEFPRNYHYMMNLAETLELFENGSRSQREQYQNEDGSLRIRNLCLLVLDDCTDNEERCRALRLLCHYYVSTGNTSEALHLTKGVADMEHCREILLGQILSGEEKLKILQQNMLQSIDYTATTMVNLAFRKDYGFTDKLTVDEKIQYILSANHLYAIMIPDGNYQFYHHTLAWNYRRLAELYLLQGKQNDAFAQLLLAEKHAVSYDNLTDFHYTAPLLNTLTYDPASSTKSWQGSEQSMLLYRLTELKKYFKDHEDFAQMIHRLQNAVHGQTPIQIE